MTDVIQADLATRDLLLGQHLLDASNGTAERVLGVDVAGIE